MLSVLQFPFADVRDFLSVETGRLQKPVWRLPQPDREFIRSFGPLKKRRRGGLMGWPREEFFCRATRALRLEPPFRGPESFGPVSVMRDCEFRRFLYDGKAVARVEIGVRFRRVGGGPFLLGARECLALLASTLRLPVQVPAGASPPASLPLVTVDRALARHYVRSTSTRSESGAAPAWWFAPGDPLLLLEYLTDADIGELPPHTRRVRGLGDDGVELAHYRFSIERRDVAVWLLGYTPAQANPDFVRRLRLQLCRFHAELEAIKQVFRLLAEEKICPDQGSGASDRLQRYLLKATGLLSKDTRGGVPQSELLDVVQQFQDMVNEGERATLLDVLSDIRPNVRRNVEQFTEPRSMGLPPYIFHDSQVTIVQGTKVEGDMSTQSVNISGSNVHGDVNTVAAGVVQDSFKRVEGANAGDALKAALKALHEAVDEMLKHLPAEKQVEVARDLEALAQEAVSSKPRRRWYELSAEGLMEAAKSMGEIAGPVSTAVKAVVGLLS